MLARDVNSNPTQYRTWIVANTPDFTGEFYTGYKSGPNPFVDVSAYAINTDSVIADFNLPLPTSWRATPSELITDFPVRKVLPFPSEDSHFAIVDGYAYMFGGKVTDKIYMASLNNPADWVDSGATLPTPLYGASLAIIGEYIYLFGGNSGNGSNMGTGAVDTIFSAPLSNPLEWTNLGSLLPRQLFYSNLGMYNGTLYLFGGLEVNNASNVILTASTADPLTWTDTGVTLPVALYGSILAQVNNSWILYGGQSSPDSPTADIFTASISDPTNWSYDGYLPYATAFGQFFTIGHSGYIVGPVVNQTPFTGFTPILQCNLVEPTIFTDALQVVPAVLSHSQVAIIYDRIWFFGGSGETAIFTCNQTLKYLFTNSAANNYATLTRIVLPATDNLDNPYQALCFPYWRTDYPF